MVYILLKNEILFQNTQILIKTLNIKQLFLYNLFKLDGNIEKYDKILLKKENK